MKSISMRELRNALAGFKPKEIRICISDEITGYTVPWSAKKGELTVLTERPRELLEADYVVTTEELKKFVPCDVRGLILVKPSQLDDVERAIQELF